MTEQHPLVDYLTSDEVPLIHAYLDPKESVYLLDDMILAADWQLERVIEWLKENLRRNWIEEDGSDWCLDPWELVVPEKVISDLKEAMRPQQQQQQENN